jgi:glycerate 2-kinase
MRIVVAPDSFKECLSGPEVGKSISDGLSAHIPEAHIDILPMADGGEGTVEALVYAANGRTVEVEAEDPFGKKIMSGYGVLGDNQTVIIEMAKVAGMQVISQRDPMTASTYGVGELMNHAISNGYRKIIVGLGGSATNDGGQGMLQALGGKFFDISGNPVPLGGGYVNKISKIDLSDIIPEVYQSKIIIASDVKNQLCGKDGATYVFGPQKGMPEHKLAEVDQGISHFANLIENEIGKKIRDIPGSGAAGGLGFGLLALNAEIQSGAAIVAEAMKLDEYIKHADWVITGEGKSDFQSVYGKVPVHVAKIAQNHGVKTILISGALGANYQQLYQYFTSCHSISNRPMSLSESIENAKQLLYETAYNVARLIQLDKR